MRITTTLLLCPALICVACSDDQDASNPPVSHPNVDAAQDAPSIDAAVDQGVDAPVDTGIDIDRPDASDAQSEPAPTSCNFDYAAVFPPPPPPSAPAPRAPEATQASSAVATIAHAEPAPRSVTAVLRPGPQDPPAPSYIVMPEYSDTMPLFDRGAAWTSPTRCYETPLGVQELTESEAFDMYSRIASETTGVPFPTTPGRRSVVGIRGAYPGTFAWHGNTPNYFNDTLVLLWIDPDNNRHVREFPVNTDTGAHNFGVDSSSSLRPDRRYKYVNGWHRDYNALHIDEDGYRVRDDTNHNGHWDSDRNGWLAPTDDQDHDRAGGGHNIHMGSVDAPLGEALVDNWSAGCQVIPGMANWTEFINNAWTQEGDAVDYFLIDARDIAPEAWQACTPDGSRACPFRIDSFPFSDTRDSSQGQSSFGVYNCSTADESGPEFVYVIRVDQAGSLNVSVDCASPVDIDVHLLDGDDANACLARDDTDFTYDLAPGRYLIVADTYESAAGSYTIHVDFQ